jgi:glycosyltransferase involved in cell wall biosynthesis
VNRARLGICIPTYRRPELLRLCLRSVLRSAHGNVIPVFISDDSGDETNREVITQLSVEHPLIHWHRNERTLGIDRNVLASASLCTADYAWLLGEDDLIAPEAIPSVLNILTGMQPDFLCVNYSYVSNDYRYYLKERVIDLQSDCSMPAATFLEKYAWSMGFLGACVVRRSIWQPDPGFIGTYYAHVGSILAGLKGRRVYVIARPLVLNRAENAKSFTWSAKAFDVFFGFESMLSRLHERDGFFDLRAALDSSKVLFRHRSVAWLVSKRADGLYDLGAFRRFIRDSDSSRPFKALSLLVAVCPRTVCMIAKFLARDLPRRLRRRRIPRATVPE